MIIVGMWAVVLGYALVYAGTAYFIQGPNAPGLAQVFGISSSLQGTSPQSATGASSSTTASTLQTV